MSGLPTLFIFFLCSTAAAAAPVPVDVGVILDLGNPVGQTCRVSINMALADFYAARPNSTTNLRLHFRDSRSDVVAAASAAVDLISSDRVTAILGPQTSLTASFVADVGARSHVPVVSFSATSASVSHSRSPFFVRAAVVDSAAANPIAALVQAFGWRRVVPIYEDSDFGSSFVPALVDALDAVGSHVPYRVSIPVSATDDRIQAELYKLKSQQTRVFVVHVTYPLASRVFTNAKDTGLMDKGFAWIVTDGVTGSVGSIDPSLVSESMQGVLGVMPSFPKSDRLNDFRVRWRTNFLMENKFSSVVRVSTRGVWAYDAVYALAMAAEAARPVNPGPGPPSSATDLSRLPVLQTGENFLSRILSTEFAGLAGEFKLDNGELNASAFQIVNFVGDTGHTVGYWTETRGLTRRLGRPSNASEAALRPVQWPGDTMEVPKGFVQPTSGEIMRIAVPGPVEPGFRAFLNVQKDNTTNKTTASGFVIEVFEAAVRRLPYALQFEYVMKPHKNDSYDTLIKQVPKVYQAVVGDVTITAMRANFVDFTMPYAVSGVSMVVPLNDIGNTNGWIFLKPLKGDLWLVSFLFFVFTGVVVWFLEHRINEEFRGPPSHQAGTIFYFIFSTLVFSHKEAIVSNLARVVVVVWVFVVLILQSSYTANLTSMLTVPKVQPAITDLKALLNAKGNVGHLQNSFVPKFLQKQGFDASRLRPYKSPQEYAEALSDGTIVAVVDEIPYLKVFLKDYCANYTMVQEQNKTGGFGFVFPKGSSIVPDLSRAILNLTESDEMVEIERRWFGDQSTCADDNGPFSSSSLNFLNFWGLFLITGLASTLCLIICVASFLYKNWHEFAPRGSSVTERVQSIVTLYDGRDPRSRTFRRDSQLRNRWSMAAGTRDGSVAPFDNNVINMESPMSTPNHQGVEDGRDSVELPGPVAETPEHRHVEMTTSNA